MVPCLRLPRFSCSNVLDSFDRAENARSSGKTSVPRLGTEAFQARRSRVEPISVRRAPTRKQLRNACRAFHLTHCLIGVAVDSFACRGRMRKLGLWWTAALQTKPAINIPSSKSSKIENISLSSVPRTPSSLQRQ